MSALPIHAWVYGLHRAGATRDEYATRGASAVHSKGSEPWRMACGATFCGADENFRIFGPRRLPVVWPLKRAEVTCEACREAVDKLVPAASSARNPRGTAYVGALLAGADAVAWRDERAEIKRRAVKRLALNRWAAETRGAYVRDCRICREPFGFVIVCGGRPLYCSEACRNAAETLNDRRWRERQRRKAKS